MKELYTLLLALFGRPLPPAAGHVPPRPLPASPMAPSAPAVADGSAPGGWTLGLQPGEILVRADPQWHAVPGQRIELGDTGFSITLRTGPNDYVYELGGPEGQRLSLSGDLDSLKKVAMRLARERLEFVYTHEAGTR